MIGALLLKCGSRISRAGVYLTMDWRRGVRYGLLHLCFILPLGIFSTARDWHYICRQPWVTAFLAADQCVLGQEIDFSFEPDYWPSPGEQAPALFQLPATVLTGAMAPYKPPCYTLGELWSLLAGPTSRLSFLANTLNFLFFVFLQWTVVGAAPILQSGRWNFARLALYFELPTILLFLCNIVTSHLYPNQLLLDFEPTRAHQWAEHLVTLLPALITVLGWLLWALAVFLMGVRALAGVVDRAIVRFRVQTPAS